MISSLVTGSTIRASVVRDMVIDQPPDAVAREVLRAYRGVGDVLGRAERRDALVGAVEVDDLDAVPVVPVLPERFVRTDGLLAEQEAGRSLWAGLAENPEIAIRRDGWGRGAG